MRRAVLALLASALLAACPAAATEVSEQVLDVPVNVRDGYGKPIAQQIVVTIFEAAGRASYPLLVLNHGRPVDTAGRVKMGRVRFTQAAKYFASLGWSVWVPTRIGYGASGTDEDPEYSGTCNQKRYQPAYAAGTDQVVQVIEYARRLPRIDASRIVAVGQSFGGTMSIALAARNPPGLLATVNFAGGGGGNPATRPGEPCAPSALETLFRDYGKTARTPTLWIYAENDQYFHPRYTRAWHAAYQSQGAPSEFVLIPPFGENGHLFFSRGFDTWKPIIERFLAPHVPPDAR